MPGLNLLAVSRSHYGMHAPQFSFPPFSSDVLDVDDQNRSAAAWDFTLPLQPAVMPCLVAIDAQGK
jgi:hypothetical protein